MEEWQRSNYENIRGLVMIRIAKHVNRILEQMQSPTEEREEIKEELIRHLQTAKQDYMNQ